MENSRGCRCRFGVSLLLLAFLSFPNKGLALINLRDKYVSQSSNYSNGYPTKAVDDDIYSISHTECGGYQWWRVDLENAYRVERITIINRHDQHGSRLTGAIVRAGLNLDHSRNQQIGSSVRRNQASPGGQTIHFGANPSVMARYVSVELSGSCLQLADLRIEEETLVSTGECGGFL
ncbi:fucolectin-3-like [Acanthaster planci]|uniref:Fucolectin-3-like n=1 Tax=Acanthaster planci TaxID=133434 RepID=A0A8B7YXF9_ACAPL|nr:fucolectin-3-like [Acanthaster planci]